MSLLYMTRPTEFIMNYHGLFGLCSNAQERIQPEYLKRVTNSLKKLIDILLLALLHFQLSFKYLKLHYCTLAPFSVKALVAHSCLILCDPIDCSLQGSSLHGILQARILAWVAMPFLSTSS